MFKRIFLGTTITLLLISTVTLAFYFQPVKTNSSTITVPDNYPTIQEAISHANEGDTIFVRNGTYYENVVVDKNGLMLVGESRDTTLIDGNTTGYCVRIESDSVVFRDFTVRNGHFVGIRVHENVSDVLIKDNIVLDSDWGIYLGLCSNVTVEDNLVKRCSDGLFLESSSYNLLVRNTIVENHNGITLKPALYIPEFPPPPSSNFNAIYHNNFIDNDFQAFDYGLGNTWDDGYPSGGNYWSDHNPPDLYSGPFQNQTGSDGIGDLPYIIDENNRDGYPLIYPYGYVPNPDINNDGIIDILDLVTIALAYGSVPGLPIWKPYADIVQDEIIDIFDLVTVTIHYGETYS
jgi:parallel beta-helix repeat protein